MLAATWNQELATEYGKLIDVLYSIFKMVQYGRMTGQQFADSRLRTRKMRRIKNIVLLVAIAAILAVFLIVYLPLLQKAFLM